MFALFFGGADLYLIIIILYFYNLYNFVNASYSSIIYGCCSLVIVQVNSVTGLLSRDLIAKFGLKITHNI
ncbi:hypothetical protein L6452_22644 [Arctium lappa]|uniref:Uncharacterized protein n=1 Tax=Arctium lappa TaxID=4217 RepID=A0ACB9B158_ARCLA|nr:hypothetical protein L6452_22644 [Arctium lappa]